MDVSDRWWTLAEKRSDDHSTIPSWLHEAVMKLSSEQRRDCMQVDAAAKEGTDCDEAQLPPTWGRKNPIGLGTVVLMLS